MKTFFALLIAFGQNSATGGTELIAFTGSSGARYGLYETLDECKAAAKSAKNIQVEMADRWFAVTCIPVSRN